MEGFVALPDEVKVGIISAVLWLVSVVFAYLITLAPFFRFLEDFKQPIALAIAAALIGALENAIPDSLGAAAVIGIQLVLALLALFGVGTVLKKRGYRLF